MRRRLCFFNCCLAMGTWPVWQAIMDSQWRPVLFHEPEDQNCQPNAIRDKTVWSGERERRTCAACVQSHQPCTFVQVQTLASSYPKPVARDVGIIVVSMRPMGCPVGLVPGRTTQGYGWSPNKLACSHAPVASLRGFRHVALRCL